MPARMSDHHNVAHDALLDYAAGRIFLRKVGGGYIFIHRMLMEYFASLESIPPASRNE
jgi:hypothetical protein